MVVLKLLILVNFKLAECDGLLERTDFFISFTLGVCGGVEWRFWLNWLVAIPAHLIIPALSLLPVFASLPSVHSILIDAC